LNELLELAMNVVSGSEPRCVDLNAAQLELLGKGMSVSTHLQFMEWMQSESMQQAIAHQIFIAAWGNFAEGSVQHDIASRIPGVRSYGLGTGSLPFVLSKLHGYWLAEGRVSCVLPMAQFSHLAGSASLPASFGSALVSMRSALVCGGKDARGGYDSLYVFLSQGAEDSFAPASMPCALMAVIDAALRRIAPLPQQCSLPFIPTYAGGIRPEFNDDGSCLSGREAQIMAWVAMGKTNSEIGTILDISGYTVKNHMQRIFHKLNVFNRTQAVSKVSRVRVHG
jgi:transcriptional regulator EpsA